MVCEPFMNRNPQRRSLHFRPIDDKQGPFMTSAKNTIRDKEHDSSYKKKKTVGIQSIIPQVCVRPIEWSILQRVLHAA